MISLALVGAVPPITPTEHFEVHPLEEAWLRGKGPLKDHFPKQGIVHFQHPWPIRMQIDGLLGRMSRRNGPLTRTSYAFQGAAL